DTTAALSDAAADSCEPDTIKSDWNAAFDAWMGVSHLRFGPVEDEGRSVIIAFWPDAKGMTPKGLSRLIADEDPIVKDPKAFKDVSVAARGLFALEFLLYDDQFDATAPYTCDLVRAVTADLADIAGKVSDAWKDGYAETLRTAGAPGNTTYLTREEGLQVLYTNLVAGLEFTANERLGRPLGTFDSPRPNRAEARRSERSLRNVTLSINALQNLTDTLVDAPLPATDAAFAAAASTAAELNDPTFDMVSDVSDRLKVEILQQKVKAAEVAVLSEVGPALGVSKGFNAGDGD
ncbi:MAG: imelysin family protein, partial [Rhodobacterales bacterium]